jgi:hypothetical protein
MGMKEKKTYFCPLVYFMTDDSTDHNIILFAVC